jgi:uncharacterized membrane protein
MVFAWSDFVNLHAVWLYSLSQVNGRSYSRYFSAVKKNSCFLGQAIFAKQKTRNAKQENDRRVIKATKEISMQPLILLAAVSMMVLYVLIIVGCLCYVGRHGRRTS